MELHDFVKFANENKTCYVATTEGDQPRVRGFLLWFADETGFYFHTESSKNVYEQLKNNLKVEVCFYVPDIQPNVGKMMRVSGKIEFVEDATLKSRLLEERPFLKYADKEKPDNSSLVIFKIATGEVYFWTIENNMRESEIQKFRF